MCWTILVDTLHFISVIAHRGRSNGVRPLVFVQSVVQKNADPCTTLNVTRGQNTAILRQKFIFLDFTVFVFHTVVQFLSWAFRRHYMSIILHFIFVPRPIDIYDLKKKQKLIRFYDIKSLQIVLGNYYHF